MIVFIECDNVQNSLKDDFIIFSINYKYKINGINKRVTSRNSKMD